MYFEVLGTGVGNYSVTTDAGTGVSTILNVPKSSFTVKCSKDGFVTTYVWQNLTPFTPADLFEPTIYTWTDFDNMGNLATPPVTINHNQAVVWGRVLNNTESAGVPGVTVNRTPAAGTVYYSNADGSLPDFDSPSTSGYGSFYIINVPNNTYNINANKTGMTYSSTSVTVTEPALYIVKWMKEN